jgi:hypothetical protein
MGLMIDVAVLYAVLRDVARSKGIISYEDLSRLYQEAGGEWHEPDETWDGPLVEINGHTRAAGLPPLSTLVTCKPRQEGNFEPPGGGFWSSPGVPPRPRRVDDCLMIWMGFLNLAHKALWPETLPGLP